MTAKKWPSPHFGDVVWCRFPYGGEPTTVRHPCLVLETSTNTKTGEVVLIVAGGTSSNKSGTWEKRPSNTDFLVQPPHIKNSGLSHATKFNFEPLVFDSDGVMLAGAVLTLPYNEEYFVVISPSMTPVSGKLDILNTAQLREAFVNASKNANLKQTLEQEKARYAKQPKTPIRNKKDTP